MIKEEPIIIDYLFSSYIYVEGAPYYEIDRHSTFIKIMEYISAGKSIVGFDLKETRYSTNINAKLLAKNDVREFGKAIKQFIDDPDLRERIGRSALERVQNEFNWESAAEIRRNSCDFLNT